MKRVGLLRTKPLAEREKLSATMRAAHAVKIVWTDDDVATIRAAFRAGGLGAVRAAFPDRSESTLTSAIRRYCQTPPSIVSGRSDSRASVWDQNHE